MLEKTLKENIDKLNECYSRAGRNHEFIKIENRLLSLCSVEEYAQILNEVEGINKEKFISKVENSGAISIYCFANAYRDSDVTSRLLNQVLSRESGYALYLFAKNIVNGEDRERIFARLIELNALEYLLMYVRDIDKSKLEDVQSLILKSKNPYLIYKFALIPNSNTQRLQKALIKTKSVPFLREFAEHVRRADVMVIDYAIVEIEEEQTLNQIKNLSKQTTTDLD